MCRRPLAALSLVIVLSLGIVVVACGGSSPAGPDGSGSGMLEGRAISAIDGAAAGGVAIGIGARNTTADAEGYFRVDVGKPSTYSLLARGSGIVERESAIVGPGAEPARVSLIPTSFDLHSFGEMFRPNGELQRWTTRPSLVVIASVLNYFAGQRESYPTTDEQMTDEEVTQLIAHVTEGLSILTAGTFTAFESVEIERPASGASVDVNRTGTIVVGRYNRIVLHSNTIGLGQWALGGDGSVRAGSMFLDREFDKTDNRRRLLRIHELGHALGQMHVNDRPSIMNPNLGPDVTDFDRAAAAIAFARPIGNRAPDKDPVGVPGVRSTNGPLVWAPPVVCR